MSLVVALLVALSFASFVPVHTVGAGPSVVVIHANTAGGGPGAVTMDNTAGGGPG